MRWRKQFSVRSCTILHHYHCTHPPHLMPLQMAMHQPHPCTSTTTTRVTSSILVSNTLIQQEKKKLTWIVCSESDGNPTTIRNAHSRFLNRILKIIPQGVVFGVEIAESPAHNIEAIAMQMHWMVVTSKQIRPLQNHLNTSIVVQHQRPRRELRRKKIIRQILAVVIKHSRWITRKVGVENTTNPIIVCLENVDRRRNKANVVQTSRKPLPKRA